MSDLLWKDRKGTRIVRIVDLVGAMEEVVVTFMDMEDGSLFELDDESFVLQYEACGIMKHEEYS